MTPFIRLNAEQYMVGDWNDCTDAFRQVYLVLSLLSVFHELFIMLLNCRGAHRPPEFDFGGSAPVMNVTLKIRFLL